MELAPRVFRQADIVAARFARGLPLALRTQTRDDLRQEALLAALLAIPRIDPAISQGTSFLEARMTGAMIDYARRETGARGERPPRQNVPIPVTMSDESSDVMHTTLLSEVRTWGRFLGGQQAAVFACMLRGLTGNETSIELGLSVQRVSQLKQHLIAKLRRKLRIRVQDEIERMMGEGCPHDIPAPCDAETRLSHIVSNHSTAIDVAAAGSLDAGQ